MSKKPRQATVPDTHNIRLDPLSVNVRLYNQASELLHQLETSPHVTLRERYMALVAVGRIQVIFMGLRKEKLDDSNAGSAVRKYATAFKAHGDGGRKAIAGPAAPEPEPDIGLDDIWGDDDDDAAA